MSDLEVSGEFPDRATSIPQGVPSRLFCPAVLDCDLIPFSVVNKLLARQDSLSTAGLVNRWI